MNHLLAADGAGAGAGAGAAGGSGGSSGGGNNGVVVFDCRPQVNATL